MRSREEVIRDFVQQWLNKAESDLAAADVLLATDRLDYSALILGAMHLLPAHCSKDASHRCIAPARRYAIGARAHSRVSLF